jgi:nucleoid DNA-binding protein
MFVEYVDRHWLDGRVAELLGERTADISLITDAFLNEVRKALVSGKVVNLDGLGQLHVEHRRCDQIMVTSRGETLHVRVRRQVGFRKAQALARALKERYGPGARRAK